MKNTKIEWAHHTFNPWIGCTKVSPACDNCYAEKSMPAKMQGVAWGAHADRRRTSDANWKQPLRWNAEAEKLGVRYRVFCASLADVFDNAVPQEWRDDLFKLIEQTPHLDWLLLTKRIGNVGNMPPVPFDLDRLYPNVWIGATICNQEEADRDIPKLLAVPAAKRFLSMEPLLGSVNLWRWLINALHNDHIDLSGTIEPNDMRLVGNVWFRDKSIDWVIVGGESGQNARPMHPDWVRSLRDQCSAAGVPFFFKQWGEWSPYADAAKNSVWVALDGSGHVGIESEAGEELWNAALSKTLTTKWMLATKVGKRTAGRTLDGLEWSEVPA